MVGWGGRRMGSLTCYPESGVLCHSQSKAVEMLLSAADELLVEGDRLEKEEKEKAEQAQQEQQQGGRCVLPCSSCALVGMKQR